MLPLAGVYLRQSPHREAHTLGSRAHIGQVNAHHRQPQLKQRAAAWRAEGRKTLQQLRPSSLSTMRPHLSAVPALAGPTALGSPSAMGILQVERGMSIASQQGCRLALLLSGPTGNELATA